MAEPTPLPRSPLAGHIAPGRFGQRDGPAGVVANEIGNRCIAAIGVRPGRRELLAQSVRRAYALDLPGTPRRVAGDGVAIQWNGPGRWLVIANGAPAGGTEAHLADLFGEHATVVDQSHAFMQLRLGGPKVREVLAKGVTVDLHPRAFGPGDVALTTVAHIGSVIAQLDAGPDYEFLTARSSALSFWHWLEASAAEFGLVLEDADVHEGLPLRLGNEQAVGRKPGL